MKRGIVNKALQRYWRISRGLTMGAQGVVLDGDRRVLLVRHTYRPGWHFPGGGVEKNETVLSTVMRELEEEAGIICAREPTLFAIYANFHLFPCDHIAVFVVRDWTQPNPPAPNREIAEHRFFDIDALPEDATPAVPARIAEILRGASVGEYWLNEVPV